MSTEPTTTTSSAAEPAQSWPVLGRHERRVLGVLVEKAKTTPDYYPLSLNALITGCNQKNNRDPVTNLVEDEVNEAVAQLKKLGLVQQITGSGRVDKYRHVLYDAWKVDKVQLAIIGELLLRGPQTEGELRGRANRMEPIADLDELRPQLQTLAQRGLVVYLSPEGRRGTTVTHGFHSGEELERLRAGAPTQPAAATRHPSPESSGGMPAGMEERLLAVERELASLRNELRQLQAALAPSAGGIPSAEQRQD